jgi:glycosyltransferase involved in cell wall biosynthesis
MAYLRRRGFDVVAITSRSNLLDAPGELVDAFRRREGIETHTVPLHPRMVPWHDLVSLLRIWRLLLRTRPAIVQGGTPKSAFLALLAATLCPGSPKRVYLMRGVRTLEHRGWRRLVVRSVERTTCRVADVILCNSESTRSAAIEAGLAPPSRLRVLHHGTGNGIDGERFDPDRFSVRERLECRRELGIPEGTFVLLCVGRISLGKGFAELVKAWRALRVLAPESHLVVAGPHDAADPVSSSLYHELARDPRVHLPGYVFDIDRYYAMADLLVHPSHFEGLPNAILEAAAMRVPAVAFRTRGCSDAIDDGKTGSLVPFLDVDAFVAAVASLIGSPDRRAAFGRAGRERVLRLFRPEDVWAALVDEYRRLLA